MKVWLFGLALGCLQLACNDESLESPDAAEVFDSARPWTPPVNRRPSDAPVDEDARVFPSPDYNDRWPERRERSLDASRAPAMARCAQNPRHEGAALDRCAVTIGADCLVVFEVEAEQAPVSCDAICDDAAAECASAWEHRRPLTCATATTGRRAECSTPVRYGACQCTPTSPRDAGPPPDAAPPLPEVCLDPAARAEPGCTHCDHYCDQVLIDCPQIYACPAECMAACAEMNAGSRWEDTSACRARVALAGYCDEAGPEGGPSCSAEGTRARPLPLIFNEEGVASHWRSVTLSASGWYRLTLEETADLTILVSMSDPTEDGSERCDLPIALYRGDELTPIAVGSRDTHTHQCTDPFRYCAVISPALTRRVARLPPGEYFIHAVPERERWFEVEAIRSAPHRLGEVCDVPSEQWLNFEALFAPLYSACDEGLSCRCPEGTRWTCSERLGCHDLELPITDDDRLGSPTCIEDVCGDGIQGDTEDCDDGNEVEGDGCEACRIIPGPVGAACSEFDRRHACVEGTSCVNRICAVNRCGDGYVTEGEACDPRFDASGCVDCQIVPIPIGGTCRWHGFPCVDGAYCDDTEDRCVAHRCGDGLVNPPTEACDAGPDGGFWCDEACRLRPMVQATQNGCLAAPNVVFPPDAAWVARFDLDGYPDSVFFEFNLPRPSLVTVEFAHIDLTWHCTGPRIEWRDSDGRVLRTEAPECTRTAPIALGAGVHRLSVRRIRWRNYPAPLFIGINRVVLP